MDDFAIELPISEYFYSLNGLINVCSISSEDLKISLQLFATYFKKEFRYDFLQYNVKQSGNDTRYEGFLFSEFAMDYLEEDSPACYRLIGGGCFKLGHDNTWRLDWVWLHPFARHRGNLSKHWGGFRKRYGEFSIEEPLSPDMADFLRKNV